MQKIAKYNYYNILELKQDCSDSEIHQAYRRLKATYSGNNPAIYTVFSQEEAKELLQMIEEAYLVLGNFSLRNLYNEKISSKYTHVEELAYEALQLELKKGIVFKEVVAEQKPSFIVNHDFETEIREKKDFPGAFLKRVREYKGYSVEQISQITKINPFYVTALEEEDYSNLPAPVFIRGYIIQISKTLAIDEKKAADSYMAIYKSKIGSDH